ncbi:hypothetical protein [Streptomyces sp. URMC 125]|uniref:hypothetical protein n=1 Tax=Streptomyces sp. URMC 125 TaxID=3423419 RepID=UPI003F1BD25C
MSATSTARHAGGPGPDAGPDGRDARGGRPGRIVRSPLGWMLTGLVGVGLVSGLTATGPGPVPVLGAAAAVAVHRLVMRRVARRSTPETARRGDGREALLGGAIGLGFVLVSAALITAFGGYSFSWAGHGFMAVVWSAVMVQIGAAVTEELLFRGLALQALEQLLGIPVSGHASEGLFTVDVHGSAVLPAARRGGCPAAQRRVTRATRSSQPASRRSSGMPRCSVRWCRSATSR